MKLLFLDVETSPNVVHCWGLFNQFVGLNQIIEPSHTLCWSAKWYGSDEVMFDSLHKSNSKVMLRRIYKLMEEADGIITYNGDSFDLTVLNKDFISIGLNPPQPAHSIDLYKVVRKKFRFPSRKLSYVVKELGLGEKMETDHSLWVGCMEDDDDSWIKMEAYNKQDIRILEKLYDRIKGWIPSHPNHGLYTESLGHVCPNCGSGNVMARGFRKTRTQVYKRYQCRPCGAWSSSRLSEKLDTKGVLK